MPTDTHLNNRNILGNYSKEVVTFEQHECKIKCEQNKNSL